MVELVMILEDSAHEALLRPLVERLALQENVPLRLRIRSVRGGYGRVLDHLGGLERECKPGGAARPDGVLVAVDANCKGFVERRNAVMARAGTLVDRLIPAIPDPHVERWLLLDSVAFKAVVGRGCQAPDGKCEKDRYKRLLMQAVREAGVEPLLGGIEHARGIAGEMDVKKVAAMDASFGHFVEALRAWLKRMKPG